MYINYWKEPAFGGSAWWAILYSSDGKSLRQQRVKTRKFLFKNVIDVWLREYKEKYPNKTIKVIKLK